MENSDSKPGLVELAEHPEGKSTRRRKTLISKETLISNLGRWEPFTRTHLKEMENSDSKPGLVELAEHPEGKSTRRRKTLISKETLISNPGRWSSVSTLKGKSTYRRRKTLISNRGGGAR